MHMKMAFKTILAVFAIFMLPACGGGASPTSSPPDSTIHASPSGSGAACSATAPCDLLTAQQAARAAKGGTVALHGGTYALAAPLTFTSADSGSTYQAAPGETPILSGGQRVTGWSRTPGANTWQAPAGFETRHLYVNGRRASRAGGDASSLGAVTKTRAGLLVGSTAIQQWRNPDRIELVFTGLNAGAQWTQSRCGIASVQPASGGSEIVMKQPCWDNATIHRPGGQTLVAPDAIENAAELMAPGQWYLDRPAGLIYYAPLPGETLEAIDAIAPTLEALLIGNQVQGLQMTGITFAYATWLRPSGPEGFAEVQANVTVTGADAAWTVTPANVAFTASRGIRIDRCTFARLGAGGLSFDGGTQDSSVTGSVFSDISGTAIRAGSIDSPNATADKQDAGLTVANNYVHDIAVEYRGGIGIMAGYVARTAITHNEVAHVPYTGISVGWGWGASSYAASNEIAYNHVHHHMQTLADGGAIYTLGPQGTQSAPSSVHHNYVHDQPRESGALYFDEGSAHFSVRSNVVASSPYWLFIWTASIHDIQADGNYTDGSPMRNDGTENSVTNTSALTTWTPAAAAIIGASGLEPAYVDIKR